MKRLEYLNLKLKALKPDSCEACTCEICIWIDKYTLCRTLKIRWLWYVNSRIVFVNSSLQRAYSNLTSTCQLWGRKYHPPDLASPNISMCITSARPLSARLCVCDWAAGRRHSFVSMGTEGKWCDHEWKLLLTYLFESKHRTSIHRVRSFKIGEELGFA